MVSSGMQVNVLFPDKSNQQMLCEGTVLDSDDRTFIAQFWEPIQPVFGGSVQVHYDAPEGFMQAYAAVLACPNAEQPTTLRFAILNVLLPDDSRSSVPVSVINVGPHVVDIDGSKCRLVDVSAEGFAAISPAGFGVGIVAPVAIPYHGEWFSGRARVCSAWELGDGQWRCDFQALEAEEPLKNALHTTTVESLGLLSGELFSKSSRL